MSGQSRNTEPLFKRDRIVTATTTLGPTDDIVLANAAGGAIVLNVPSAANFRGRSITVIKTDATANAVTFTPSGGETVNGAATNVINVQYNKATYSPVLLTAPNTYGWLITRT